MTLLPTVLLWFAAVAADPLAPGDRLVNLSVGESQRVYLVHVPPGYDAAKPMPVVLVFHGAGMNGGAMAQFCGMNAKADAAGFVAVYPYGTGIGNLFLVWNAGGPNPLKLKRPDDVVFVRALLDDLATRVNVDPKRVFATGLSNGGMMSYRLAADLNDRIAAVAPVAGTMIGELPDGQPKRPVPLMHFHGLADRIVRMGGAENHQAPFMPFKSVDESVAVWVKANGCADLPTTEPLPDTADDGCTVTCKRWPPGRDGAEVCLYLIDGAGHTWPGMTPPLNALGKSTKDISANDLIWAFFERHPLP